MATFSVFLSNRVLFFATNTKKYVWQIPLSPKIDKTKKMFPLKDGFCVRKSPSQYDEAKRQNICAVF